MSVTNTIQCSAYETFDLYSAILRGKITFSTDRHLVLLDFDVDNLGISSITEEPRDPINPGTHGALHYNTQNGKIYFGNGDEFVLVGVVLPRDGVNVISRGLQAAPSSSNEGDQYIISPFPRDEWRLYKNQIARFEGGAWEFIVPEVGCVCGVENEFTNYSWDGYTWAKHFDTPWVKAIPLDGYSLKDDDEILSITFGGIPGTVSSGNSGNSGVALLVSRSDHNHNLGPHSHANDLSGGKISHSSLLDINPNDHHRQIHSGLDHTGVIGTWAQIDLSRSSLRDIINRPHSDLTGIGVATHDDIDVFITTHDHDGTNSKQVKYIDGGVF
jgi:hypothetical protein